MNVRIERKTTVITSYELDLSTLNILKFKQALSDSDCEWISEQFDDKDELYKLLKENSDMASDIFNVLNSYGSFGKKHEFYLDDEEYSINC